MRDQDEKEVNSLLERIQKIGEMDMDERKEIGVILGFFLSRNMWLHLLFSFLINASTMGIIFLYMNIVNNDLFTFTNVLYLGAVCLFFTMIDYLLKYFMISFTPKLLTFSVGLVMFPFYFLIMWIMDVMMKSNFSFPSTANFIIFIFFFGVARLFLTVVIRKTVTSFLLKGRD